MRTRLMDALNGNTGNYLYPFFIVTENVSPEMLRIDMKRLASNGVKGVCVEPNGNKNFVGPGWWEQMDAIMEEAKLQGMRVWLQDEPSFPTGSANNDAVNHPELQKVYLEEQHIDAVGPQQGATFMIDSHLDTSSIMFYLKHVGAYGLPHPDTKNAKANTDNGINMDPIILSVSACKKVSSDKGVDGDYIDLTEKMRNGILKWDIPEGQWRIFIVYTLRYGTGRPNYLNIFDSEAVKLLIRNLYEPHLQRYSDDFGKTFAGFFSDEPEFGNIYSYANDNSIGRKIMPLPWSAEAAGLLSAELGSNAYAMLPSLWYESGTCTARVRYAYMGILTQLYEKNFVKQIGNWCRSHNCEYIGHVVEDMGNHAKLGCGTGHYFRSMTGQDYAGIDLVLQQIRPGLDDPGLVWQGGDKGGEFFHYGLAKLGSSAAHIDPQKDGRSICEIFAAYGSSLGLKNQKWLFDHMMVRGINSFIPAWNGKASLNGESSRYDSDPQFRYNHILAAYVNRLCHLFNNGVHVAPVAVLYHAEAEWCGDYMEFEKPVRVLLQNQIDCDVLPSDVFADRDAYGTVMEKNGLVVDRETYKALVIPYSEYITTSVAGFIEEGTRQGFPVIFVDGLPKGIVGTNDESKLASLYDSISKCSCVPLEELTEVLRNHNAYEITASGSPQGLRYYHYKSGNDDIYMFFNENPSDKIRTVVEIPMDKPAVVYDPFNNKLRNIDVARMDGVSKLELNLYPYQSVILVFSDNEHTENIDVPFVIEQTGNTIGPDQPWELSLADKRSYPLFEKACILHQLTNLSDFEKYPDFSGTMRYDTTINLVNELERAVLSLGEVYEIAEVWINGLSAGVRICQPYHFDISGLLKVGVNSIRVEVLNTQAHEVKDTFSQYGAIEPSGLIGPVGIHY